MKNKILVILLLCVAAYVALSPGMFQRLTSVLAKTSQASQSLTDSIAAPGASAHYSVVGRPTINAAGINLVLKLAHSPARGTGAQLYNLGVQYGVDPIFALAFFKHESTFGTQGMARSTRSLGNIRCSNGYSCLNGYRTYSTWAAGYADWYQLIVNLYIKQLHLTTVEQIVPTYAPESENNTQAYIQDVEAAVDQWRGTKWQDKKEVLVSKDDEKELEETYGPNYKFSDHKRGDVIAYHHRDFPTTTQYGRILWVCAPIKVEGRSVGMSYLVRPYRGDMLDDVQPSDIKIEGEQKI